jgi:hypothetical protein
MEAAYISIPVDIVKCESTFAVRLLHSAPAAGDRADPGISNAVIPLSHPQTR